MDKIVHIIVFVLLGFCYRMAFPKQKYMFSVLLMAGYGAITEVLQEIMELGRSMELADFVADIFGVLLGFFIHKKLKTFTLNR